MPSPRFPATAILLDAKRCPLDKFDALFTKITQERRVRDGYFLHDHPHEPRLLFVVNGSPYGAGGVMGEACAFLEVHEFFTAYADHPESPLSFFAADKRLLLGLMVLFRHRPARTFETSLVDMAEILTTLAEQSADQILALRSGSEWAVSLCTKGRPAANFLPSGSSDAAQASTPTEQLVAYARSKADGATVAVYDETRVGPAGDVILVTPETRGRLAEVFLRVAAKVKEEEAEAPPTLETPQHEPLAVDTEAPPSFLPMEELPPPSPEPEEPPLTLEGPAGAAHVLADAPSHPHTAPQPSPPPQGPVPEVHLFVGERQLGTFSLAAGELTIGRIPGNTIVIDNAGVSRRHAVIRIAGDKVILEDLGSSNGTFVRGQRVDEHTLRDGDEISIVKHRLVYRVPKEAEAPPKVEPIADVGQRTMHIDTAAIAQAMGSRPAARPETGATTLRPRLILPDLKKYALEEEEVTLGSGKGCQIQLSGMFVGKEHAKIARTKDGQFKIRHVSGLAGTRVNGEKVSEHLLKHGDEIEIGKQKLLFRLER